MYKLFNGKRRRLLKEIVRAEISRIGRGYPEIVDFIDGKSGSHFLFPYRDEDGLLQYFWVSRKSLLANVSPNTPLYYLLLTASKQF